MKARRTALKKGAFIGVWMPEKLVKLLDRAAQALDLDRAKFLRRATKEKLARKKP